MFTRRAGSPSRSHLRRRRPPFPSDSDTKRKILRDASRQMLSVKEFIQVDEIRDGHVLTIATSALALLAAAATPQLTAAAAIAKFVSRAIPQVLVRNRDDQVGLYYLSLNRMEHYPNGERKRDNMPDLSNNVRVDYSIFGTTYTV